MVLGGRRKYWFPFIKYFRSGESSYNVDAPSHIYKVVSSLSFSPKADQSLKKRHRIDIKLVFFLQSHHPNCKSIDAWQKLPHAKDESFHPKIIKKYYILVSWLKGRFWNIGHLNWLGQVYIRLYHWEKSTGKWELDCVVQTSISTAGLISPYHWQTSQCSLYARSFPTSNTHWKFNLH